MGSLAIATCREKLLSRTSSKQIMGDEARGWHKLIVSKHGFLTMPTPAPRRMRGPKPDRRRALELLAASRDGCTEAILLAHGVTIPQMVDLVRAELATATPSRVVAGGRTMEVATVRITEAGRRALAGASP
jgi:hypothetical protein